MSRLEHVNVTVQDPKASAEVLCDLFDWKIRWEGSAIHSGRSVHVGDDDTYVALYNPDPDGTLDTYGDNYRTLRGLNHIGVVVDDLDAVEARVDAKGFQTHSHADYEPGRRFYFHDGNGLEIEVVSYS